MKDVNVSAKMYEFFSKLVLKKTGIHYPTKDIYRLENRIIALMDELNCDDPNKLIDQNMWEFNQHYKNILINTFTNNETSFFRDENLFVALKEKIFPILNRTTKPLRIWSCGCSSGQEALSLLMLLLESFPDLDKKDINIIATDISEMVLEKAEQGIYSNLEIQKGLPAKFLIKYFEEFGRSSWRLKEEFRGLIQFDNHNLIESDFLKWKNHFDLILCRNVLIYQEEDVKEKVINNILSCLRSDGYLVLGAGESILDKESEIKQIDLSSSLIFQKY